MSEGVASVTQAAPGLPPLSQLRARVYAPLRDTERSFIEPWFVDAMLNEAYTDINARLRLKRGSTTSTTSTTGTIVIPSTLVEVEDLWVGSIHPEFVSDAVFQSYAVPRTTVPYGADGLPTTIARVNGAVFETYPAVVSATYTLTFVERPTEMVAETDAPVELTKELIPRIINYAIAHAKWQEGEPQEGATFMAMYEQGLPGAPREMYRRRIGPMTLIPEPGPFDAQDA